MELNEWTPKETVHLFRDWLTNRARQQIDGYRANGDIALYSKCPQTDECIYAGVTRNGDAFIRFLRKCQ